MMSNNNNCDNNQNVSFATKDFDELVPCPYIRDHRIQRSQLGVHIMKCKARFLFRPPPIDWAAWHKQIEEESLKQQQQFYEYNNVASVECESKLFEKSNNNKSHHLCSAECEVAEMLESEQKKHHVVHNYYVDNDDYDSTSDWEQEIWRKKI